MKQTVLAFFVFFFVTVRLVSGMEEQPLRSGPMVCYVEMREAMIWVQTMYAAQVRVEYWDSTDTKQRTMTNSVDTDVKSAFTAKVIVDNLQPGHTYF